MPDVLLLAGPGAPTWITANALERAGHEFHVLLEDREPRLTFLRRRLRRLGPVVVAGQVLFQLYGVLAQRRARARIAEIMASAGLDDTPLPPQRVERVPDVNAPATRERIRALAPVAVVVCGTRILSASLLREIRVPILNLHAGMTPAYRGVHGGYWALAQGDETRCGVTVHLIDAGVDTGPIVAQIRIRPGPRDNFFTYPYLQLAAGLPALVRAVGVAVAGKPLATTPAEGESRQYFHPTLWSYLATGLRRGVW